MKQKILTNSKKMKVLTHDEIKTVLNQFEKNTHDIPKQIQIAIVVMAIFGLRPSEIASLKICDVSLEKNLIRLSDTFQVPIPDCARWLFEELIILADSSIYLFPNPNNRNQPIPVRAISCSIRILEPNFKLYSLRYSFGQFLNSIEVEHSVISASLGHKPNRNRLLNFDYLEQRREIHEALFKTLMPTRLKQKLTATGGV